MKKAVAALSMLGASGCVTAAMPPSPAEVAAIWTKQAGVDGREVVAVTDLSCHTAEQERLKAAGVKQGFACSFVADARAEDGTTRLTQIDRWYVGRDRRSHQYRSLY